MIVSLDEIKLVWGTECVRTGATDRFNGQKNMEAIRSIWDMQYPAFKWCSDRGQGWYLPAYHELEDLYASFNGSDSGTNADARAYFNGRLRYGGGTKLSEVHYWSSSENSRDVAICIDFSNGRGHNYDKTNTEMVRAVRIF